MLRPHLDLHVPLPSVPTRRPSGLGAFRRRQIGLTGYRDASGRDHEARVVHLALPETARTGWLAPQGRREVLRSLASTIAATREGNPAPDFQPTDTLPEIGRAHV